MTNTPQDFQHQQSDITELCQWVKQAGLNLNTGKTIFMIISRKISPPTTYLHVNNTSLDQVSVFKYLGVVISSKLQWNDHVHYISNKARKRLGFMYRNMRDASIATKKHLYKTTIIPILDYCCCVCAPYYTTQIYELESVQLFAFKIIANNWSYSTSTLTSLPFLRDSHPGY